ncbi:MAG: hypothetical protein WC755_05555 [Candidatus Woesearchaeota archaeon]|jgi:hypothetical protein
MDIIEKFKRWKDAYDLYVSNYFKKSEDTLICKNILIKGIAIISEGIITDNKQFFRKNKEFLTMIKMLLFKDPKLNSFEKKLIKETLMQYKVYSILKIQGMKE